MRKALLTGLASLFLLACSLFIISACSSKNVESITIDTNSLPQTTYVVGSPLDRSKGRLRLDDGNYVLLSDPNVTITGYDQNTLGEQTLTITYAGAQTQLKVNVVPRFQTAQEKYVYFVGEDFWDANPSIVVTRNDGTQIAVTDRNSISFADGDFADTYTAKAADNVNVNITYASGTDNYSGPITIQVCDPVYDFRAPTNLEYGNYETSLNTTGVRLTITNEDNTATRNVSTADITFSGFDPAGAKVDEDNTKVTQTVKVLYKGVDTGKSFDVTIVYNSVSKFLEVAEKLPEEAAWDCYSFGGEDIALFGLPEEIADNAELQREAFEAMQLYVDDIKNDQRRFISRDNLNKVARVATVYGYNTWYTEYEKNTDISNAVNVYFGNRTVGQQTISTAMATYNAVKTPAEFQTAIDAIKKILPTLNADVEDNNMLIRIGDLLQNDVFVDACGDTALYVGTSAIEGMTLEFVGGLMGNRALFNGISLELQDAITAYNTLSGVTFPTEHSERIKQENIDKLNESKTDIEAAYALLYDIANQTTDAYNASIYVAINGWRANSDYFEILYRYYFNQLENLDEDATDYDEQYETQMQILVNLMTYMTPMPIYNVQAIFSTTYNMYYSVGTNQIFESTPFLMALRELEKAEDEFISEYIDTENVADSDIMYALIYSTVMENNTTLSQLYNMYYGEYGYYYLLDYAAFDGKVEQVLNNYYNVVSRYAELLGSVTTGDDSSIFKDTDFVNSIKTMFNNFVNLDMIQQNYFLNAISYLHNSGYPEMILVPTDGFYPEFTGILYSYYSTIFQPNGEEDVNNTAWQIFEDMMYALEGYYNGDTDYFNTYMAEAVKLYNDNDSWVGVAQNIFDTELGDIYNYLLGIHDLFKEDEPEEGEETTTWSLKATLTEQEQQLLDQLNDILGDISTFNTWEQLFGYNFDFARFALYEKAHIVEEQILNSGSDALINAYKYAYNEDSGIVSTGIAASEMYNARGKILALLDGLGIDSTLYNSKEYAPLRKFLADNSEFILTATAIFYEEYLGAGQEGSSIPQPIEKTFKFTTENVKALLDSFTSLSAEQQLTLYNIGSIESIKLFDIGLIYGIDFEDLVTEGTETSAERDLLTDMLNLNLTYIYWQLVEGGQSLVDGDGNIIDANYDETILETWPEIEKAYAALDTAAKADFDGYFKSFYEYLKAGYDKVKAASEEQGSDAEEGETVTEALAA